MSLFLSFFFSGTAATEIYTLSLHDALPISEFHTRAVLSSLAVLSWAPSGLKATELTAPVWPAQHRSEEHTSELQSQFHLVCRLLLEKKNRTARHPTCTADCR